jgi:hypothetical protein
MIIRVTYLLKLTTMYSVYIVDFITNAISQMYFFIRSHRSLLVYLKT